MLQPLPADNPGHLLAGLRHKILNLAAPREEAAYTDVRSELDKLAGQMGADALAIRELSLLLNAAFLRDGPRDFKLLQGIRAERVRQDDLASFDAFWADLQTVMHPNTLGPHGYIHSLKARDSNVVWKEISEIAAKISGIGYQTFVNSGTLLGLVRSGELIAHDDDVDLAVVLHGQSVEEVATEWVALRQRLASIWLLDRKFEAQDFLHCKVRKAGGASVDLFPAWICDGKVFIWPHTYGDAEPSDLLPLQAREVAGKVVMMPAQPEKILFCNYGAGWRIPDPSFHFDWPRANKRFRPFYTAYRQARGAT